MADLKRELIYKYFVNFHLFSLFCKNMLVTFTEIV